MYTLDIHESDKTLTQESVKSILFCNHSALCLANLKLDSFKSAPNWHTTSQLITCSSALAPESPSLPWSALSYLQSPLISSQLSPVSLDQLSAISSLPWSALSYLQSPFLQSPSLQSPLRHLPLSSLPLSSLPSSGLAPVSLAAVSLSPVSLSPVSLAAVSLVAVSQLAAVSLSPVSLPGCSFPCSRLPGCLPCSSPPKTKCPQTSHPKQQAQCTCTRLSLQLSVSKYMRIKRHSPMFTASLPQCSKFVLALWIDLERLR